MNAHNKPELPSDNNDSSLKLLLNDQRSTNSLIYQIGLAVDAVVKALNTRTDPFSGVTYDELKRRFYNIDLNVTLKDVDSVVSEISDLYIDNAVLFNHPRYAAHLNCPILIPSILGEVMQACINTSVDTWDQSAGATLVENKIIGWASEKVGWGGSADGVFTSGGTQSNLMGLLLAREHAHKIMFHTKSWDEGLSKESYKFRIYCSEQSHFSLKKAAAVLGLGCNCVVPIASDEKYKMCTTSLRQRIHKDYLDNLLPIAVIGTAGTTDFGSLDPLDEIHDVCREYQLWFHVDAAYGCGLIASSKMRAKLGGVEKADSITIDFHKSFFQPVSCSAFIVREGDSLSAITMYSDYLNPGSRAAGGPPNLVDKSLQTTRRFDGLKLWMSLRSVGTEQIGKYFESVIELAKTIHKDYNQDRDFEFLHRPELSTLVFRFVGKNCYSSTILNRINICIKLSLFDSGEALVASTKVDGDDFLKITLLNPVATPKDISNILEMIREYGHMYELNEAPIDATSSG